MRLILTGECVGLKFIELVFPPPVMILFRSSDKPRKEGGGGGENLRLNCTHYDASASEPGPPCGSGGGGREKLGRECVPSSWGGLPPPAWFLWTARPATRTSRTALESATSGPSGRASRLGDARLFVGEGTLRIAAFGRYGVWSASDVRARTVLNRRGAVMRYPRGVVMLRIARVC